MSCPRRKALSVNPLSIRFVPDGTMAGVPQRSYVAVTGHAFDLTNGFSISSGLST